MTIYEIAKQGGAQLLRHREGNQYDCKPMFTGNNHHWTLMDSFTGSAIVQIYEALQPENQVKYMSLPLPRMLNVTWKIVGNS